MIFAAVASSPSIESAARGWSRVAGATVCGAHGCVDDLAIRTARFH
jgi:hypothetical protein